MPHEFSPLEWLGLFALVFIAGVIDAVAGGGGLITLPAYAAFGIPPGQLLGTNKLSSSVGTCVSTWRYLRHSRTALNSVVPTAAAAVVFSYLGARAAIAVDPDFIRRMVLILLPLAAAAVLIGKRIAPAEENFTRSGFKEAAVAAPIGFYDGVFGPGTGTFLTIAFNRGLGLDLMLSMTLAKVANLSSNVAALAAFLAYGQALVPLGAAMGLASILGHWTGAHLAIRKGSKIVEPALISICAALFAKILWDLKS